MQEEVLKALIRAALDEDIGPGDVTTGAVLSGNEGGRARAVAKTPLVAAGLRVFRDVFLTLDPALKVDVPSQEGEEARPGDVLASVEGRLAPILTAERVALNLLQRMCGIATLTRRFVQAAAGTKARIVDTRKTMPGLRILDKYAVRIGGGFNHRFALYDGVLIKDNHIAAVGGIAEAVRRAKGRLPHTLKIEVEVRTMAELEEALRSGVDAVLLDNMDLGQIAEAVRLAAGRVIVEASGNMTLEKVAAVAATGVDLISVGALTHSAPAADISLVVEQRLGKGSPQEEGCPDRESSRERSR